MGFPGAISWPAKVTLTSPVVPIKPVKSSGGPTQRKLGPSSWSKEVEAAATSSHEGADEMASLAEELKKIVGRFTY